MKISLSKAAEVAALCESLKGKTIKSKSILFKVTKCEPDPDEPELGIQLTGKINTSIDPETLPALVKTIGELITKAGFKFDSRPYVNRIISLKGKDLSITAGLDTTHD